MSQETPDTLEALASAEIKKAKLSPEDIRDVREGIIATLEVLADQGCSIAPAGVEINFQLPVSETNREVLEAVVRDSIQSLYQ